MKLPDQRRFATERHHAGFTLIEALVVVALMAILASLAAPSFTNQFQRYRVDTVRDELLASMNLAKSEAIRQGQTITIQKLAGACGTAGDWSCGWQVLDPAGTAIQEFIVPPQTSVRSREQGTLTAQNSLTFSRYGLVVGAQEVLIYPTALSPTVASPSHALLCFAVGSRVRTVRNAVPPCP